MSETGFRATSRRIQVEKSAKHIGVARVQLGILRFPNARSPDPKNVKRIKNLFQEQQGCTPDDVYNRIPALIDESTLCKALAATTLSREALLSPGPDYPILDFPPGTHLACLRGQHRVEAAKQSPNFAEFYWTIDLFEADISEEAKQDLVEEYSNERRPDDGEFYYKIRLYQGRFGQPPNPYFENRWWSRLATVSVKGSRNPRDRLNQLFKHDKFAEAFDAFQHLPAIYSGLRLSAVNKMIPMRCDEKLLRYLEHIRKFWYYVFDNNEQDMQHLDVASLRVLELKAPGACEAEAQVLYSRVCSGEILGAFDNERRQTIWRRICSETVHCLVPSLTGFFSDLTHFKLVADSFKWLVRVSGEETIQSVLKSSYTNADTGLCLVQVSDSSIKSIPAGRADPFDIAYRTLWLFAYREYEEMPVEVKKKVAGPAKGQANEEILFEFASLAHKLGFRSDQIESLRHGDPDREIARRLLLTARSPNRFRYNDLDGCIRQVAGLIKSAQAISDGEGMDEDRWIDDGKPERSGKPKPHDHLRDKTKMFINTLHASSNRETTVSSLFIQRSSYFAFFGKDCKIDITLINDMPGEMVLSDQEM
ncbi:hypothetical protein B0I35DRAFT_340040, partial [Stachybotrys elegans]